MPGLAAVPLYGSCSLEGVWVWGVFSFVITVQWMSESVRGKYYIFNIFQTHLSNFIELSLYLFKTQNGMLIFSKLIDVLDFNFL